MQHKRSTPHSPIAEPPNRKPRHHRFSDPRLGIIASGRAYLDGEALEDIGIDAAHAAQVASALKGGCPGRWSPTAARVRQGLEKSGRRGEKRQGIEYQMRGSSTTGEAASPARHRQDDEPANGKCHAATGCCRSAAGERPAMVARVIARASQFKTSRSSEARLKFLQAKEKTASHPRAKIARIRISAPVPHNTSTRGRKMKALRGSCAHMAIWIGRTDQDLTQRGGEGAPWIGISPSRDEAPCSTISATAYTTRACSRYARPWGGGDITQDLFNDAGAAGGQPWTGDQGPMPAAVAARE